MKKVLIFSLLLVAGLISSQLLHVWGPNSPVLSETIRVLTMLCLSFIMIHVGYEFEVDRTQVRTYAWDYIVAATAAAFPWIFCAFYFLFIMERGAEVSSFHHWAEVLLTSRFAAPTSAGVLFSMMAAAGLSATWVFKKARVLAIFDDVDTVLFMIPLQMLIVGPKWQLGASVFIMIALIWLAWAKLHEVRWPITWRWAFGYSIAIVAVSEVILFSSYQINASVPIHLEVLLPAFVLGCILARPRGAQLHKNDSVEGHLEGPEDPDEQRVATIISGLFMFFVGLSIPFIDLQSGGMSPSTLVIHVLVVTFLANLGKMFPFFCYRKEASLRERLALCVGMWPRGEVGGGVLVISIGYGIRGPGVTIATLSLALNLLLTGLFIVMVKKLLRVKR